MTKILALLQQKYFWSGMKNDIKKYCKICHSCQKMKTSRHKAYRTLTSLSMMKRSWFSIIMNFIMDLSSSTKNEQIYDFILVIMNWYIKMSRYFSTCKTVDASELAKLFLDNIIKQYEISMNIVSDWDSVFTSKFWLLLCFYMKIKCKLSTAFHSQTDEQSEM